MRSLLDTGALVRENGDWRLDREVEVEVPDTVERLVLSRIDRLDGPCHNVLAAAAVLGRQFELSVLERIAGEGDIAARCVSSSAWSSSGRAAVGRCRSIASAIR